MYYRVQTQNPSQDINELMRYRKTSGEWAIGYYALKVPKVARWLMENRLGERRIRALEVLEEHCRNKIGMDATTLLYPRNVQVRFIKSSPMMRNESTVLRGLLMQSRRDRGKS